MLCACEQRSYKVPTPPDAHRRQPITAPGTQLAGDEGGGKVARGRCVLWRGCSSTLRFAAASAGALA